MLWNAIKPLIKQLYNKMVNRTVNKKIDIYKYEDSIRNIKALILLNAILLFCLIVPEGKIGYHAMVLGLQLALLSIAWKMWNLKSKKSVLTLFVIYSLSTVYESVVWTQSLDGIIHGAQTASKGAPFAFLFESPPYVYPVIRVGSILLFTQIFATFKLDIWE